MSQRPRIEIRQTQRLALNASLQSSIEILRADAASLTRFLEDQAIDNPMLQVLPVAPGLGEWLPRWRSVLGMPTGGTAADADAMNQVEGPAPGLIAHVMAGAQSLSLPGRDQIIALALIESLEPSGWLGRPLTDIASENATSPAEVQRVLSRLQTLDPPGIFARNLAECLELQLQDAGQLDAPMRVLLQNLQMLAKGETARLAKLCQTDEAGILRRFRQIRALNPKPGTAFGSGQAPPLREPDLLAEPTALGGWRISLNRSALPSVEVAGLDPHAPKPPPNSAASAAAKAAKSQRARARALQGLVAARNATLLAVGSAIAQRQPAALADGPAALLPLKMADIAAQLDLHESTISRVVAGASLDTPRGTWWLRQMFSTRLGDPEGPGQSAAALRARLVQLVRDEDPQAPLTDQELADLLGAQAGVTLARRTIAKYRAVEGIPPTPRRRRR